MLGVLAVDLPPQADVVTTYAEYYKIVKAFFAGHFGLLIIVGDPGKSKSYEFQRQAEAKGGCKYVRGLGSPYKLYLSLYDYRDKDVILDDAEIYWKEADGRILLRELTEISKPASVSWAKQNARMEKEGYPTSFKTSSKVCLICNTLKFGRADEFAAIVDRGHLVYFDPTPQEVHTMAGTWAPKKFGKEIYDAVGDHLHYMPNCSARIYEKLSQAKAAERDWKKLLGTYQVNKADRFLIDLEECKGLTTADRVRLWCEYEKKSRATYFNRRKVLMRHKPEETESPDADD